MIRAARGSDAAAIAAIWNPIIAETTITFTTQAKTVPGLQALISERAPAFLVAEEAGRLLGFATYGAFRAGPGYARAREHTIMLAPAARGRGVGRALVAALEQVALTQGVHVLVGGVSGENEAGIAFHRALGFSDQARVPEVGHKFGRWLDLVLMQKIL